MSSILHNRVVRASTGTAILLCMALPAAAQDAALPLDLPTAGPATPESPAQPAPAIRSPATPPKPESLPGIPNLDFSLEGVPGGDTATREGRAVAAPGSGTDAKEALPQGDQPEDRRQSRPVAARATESAKTPANTHSTAEATKARPSALAAVPLTDNAAQPDTGNIATDGREASAPAAQTPVAPDESGGRAGFAFLFLLAAALLGGAVYLVLRTRGTRVARERKSPSVGPVKQTPAPLAEAQPPGDPAPVAPALTEMRPPLAAAGTWPAEPSPPARDAHRALRTRIPVASQPPVRASSGPSVRPSTPELPNFAMTRYDVFGLPVRDKGTPPSAPRTASTQRKTGSSAPGRRTGLVRYDVMGLPIFE